MKKIMSIMQGILIGIGVLAILLFLIPWVIGIKPFVVLSGSMHPEIPVGTIVYANTYVKPEEINAGEVIVFKLDKTYVAHRAIGVNEDNTFTTKGDANETEDVAPVKFDNYVGKAIFSIPYLGYALQFVQTATGKFILLSVIGINIVFFIFSNDEKKEKNSKKANDNK